MAIEIHDVFVKDSSPHCPGSSIPRAWIEVDTGIIYFGDKQEKAMHVSNLRSWTFAKSLPITPPVSQEALKEKPEVVLPPQKGVGAGASPARGPSAGPGPAVRKPASSRRE